MAVLTDELRERIRAEFPKYPDKQAVTLPALHIVHDALRAVSPAADRGDCRDAGAASGRSDDTMSFYGFFRDRRSRSAAHRVWVCRSISCMLRGGEELLEICANRLGMKPGQTTRRRQRDARVRRVPGRLRRRAVHAGE